MPIEAGAIIQHWTRDNQDSIARERDIARTLNNAISPDKKQRYLEVDGSVRDDVKEAWDLLVKSVPATHAELPIKIEAASDLLSTLHIRFDQDDKPDQNDVTRVNTYIDTDLEQGISDLKNGNSNTPAAMQAIELARGLIGIKLQVTASMNAFMGRGGPDQSEATRHLVLVKYREKFDETETWKGRGDEQRLMAKIGNILLVQGIDSQEVKGFIDLLESKASATGNVGDYVKAFMNLVSTDGNRPGALQNILTLGKRSGVDAKGMGGIIETLTPANIVALANLGLTVKIPNDSGALEKRVVTVGQVLEKLLTLPGGKRAWTDPHWTGEVGGADAYLKWLGTDPSAFKNAWKGMELDPGWFVYTDGTKRPAGPMDGGSTYAEDLPENIRQEKMIFALMDSKAVATLYIAARALGILTQPIPRLYGAKGIMEALPGLQKIWGTLYEDYYTNQAPIFRKRGFVSLMAMVDRAVKSPLNTIYPLPADRLTMDGFAFTEKRPQEIAKGGIKVDKDAVMAAIRAEYAREGKSIDGQALKLEMNKRLNRIDALLLNIFGCPIDDPGNFEQEYAVARVVGAMNDTLISPTCEEIKNPIEDVGARRKIAIARAQEHFTYNVETALSYTDSRARSMETLFKYVKYVHLPPEMIMHRLNLLPEEYKGLLKFVDFNGLLKRWKGIEAADNAEYKGLGAAKDAVTAMGVGVMATLPGGTTDLNSPFNQKQGGYWTNEYEAYNKFVQGYPLALQVLDDEAQRKAGIRVTAANETDERAYELINNAVSALRGINASEKIRGGAVDEYFKWVRDTAPGLTFIGGKAPVITFFHIACTVAASMVGKRFVPPYLDKEQLCYVNNDNKRQHAPLGVNDAPAEYGDFYPNLPDDILALVGVEKDATGKALMSPGRITSIPAMGMELGTYNFKETSSIKTYNVVRGSEYTFNPSEYAGSKQVFPKNPDEAYAIMVKATLNHLYDLGLLDPSERNAILKGLTILPAPRYMRVLQS